LSCSATVSSWFIGAKMTEPVADLAPARA